MGRVIAFRAEDRRPWPPIVLRVGIDFDRWCISHYCAGRLTKRESFDSEEAARTAAETLAHKSRFVVGADLPPSVTYQSWVDDGDDCA